MGLQPDSPRIKGGKMKFTWPDNAKCAVTINFEYDAESVEMGLTGEISGGADYGAFSPNYGIPRMLEILSKYSIKSTFFVPAWDAERYPDSVKDIAKAGHEIAAHGYLHEDFSKLGPEQEKKIFEKSQKILTDITGTPPRGFRNGKYNSPLSPNTLSFARDMGYIYDSSFLDDDLPYSVRIDDKPVNMVEIPWTWVLNDVTFLSPPLHSGGLGLALPIRTPAWVLDRWEKEFDVYYQEVGFFNLIVHPTFMGRGSRLPLIEGIIRFIKGYPDVWFATYNELAECCLKALNE